MEIETTKPKIKRLVAGNVDGFDGSNLEKGRILFLHHFIYLFEYFPQKSSIREMNTKQYDFAFGRSNLKFLSILKTEISG